MFPGLFILAGGAAWLLMTAAEAAWSILAAFLSSAAGTELALVSAAAECDELAGLFRE